MNLEMEAGTHQMDGTECQAEELRFSATSSREPQDALEQRSDEEQSNGICGSFLQSARLFSIFCRLPS